MTKKFKDVNLLHCKVNGSIQMEAQENRIQERNREIGRLLLEARIQKNISVTTCANLVGTSRRRYTAMEQGEATIGVAELEVLMTFLEVPTYRIWCGKDASVIPRQVVVEALPGETLQIVVDVRK
jgi:transcriptional regulator with XRE-family HTH domain